MNVGIGYLHVGILNPVAFRSSQPGAAFRCFRVVREANMTQRAARRSQVWFARWLTTMATLLLHLQI